MDLSASLQAVEAEIDGEYRSNPLLLQPRAQAVWALLSSVEEWSIAPFVSGKMRSVHDHGSGVDNQINVLKYTLHWITKGCATSGKLCRHMSRLVIRPLLSSSSLRSNIVLSPRYSNIGTKVSSNWNLMEIDWSPDTASRQTLSMKPITF